MKPVYTITQEVTVKNESHSNKRSPKCPNCGSWINHWEQVSGKKANKCSIFACNEQATDGAHTLRPFAKDEDYKTHPFILPMCHAHNMNFDNLKVKIGSTFVWANVQETCGLDD